MPQASLPSPRTWSAGDLVTVPRLRADATDAIAFLLQRPFFAGSVTTGRSWSSGSDLPMMIDSELADTWNGHQPGTAINGSVNPSQYFCQVPGWYLCRSSPAFQYTSGTQELFAGGLEGVTGGTAWGPQRGPLVLSQGTVAPVPQCIDLIEMTVTGPPGGSGDFVQFDALQNTGGSINLISAATQLPAGSARWVCATSGTQPLPVPPLTAVPSPITHSWLNANVRDAIRFLIYPPVARAYLSGSASLASTTFPAGSLVPLNASTVDNYGGLSLGASHWYQAPVSGRYLIAGQFNLQSAASATRYACGVAVNGGTITWGDGTLKASDSTGGGAGIVKRLRLNAGDTVQLFASQGSGASISYNLSGTNPTRMIIVWEGI